MKKQNNNIPPGKPAEQVALLNLLKERSGERLTRLEAYLDLVDKAAAQYVPKDLYNQDFSLSQGQFVVTITELSECWHWHRATVRSFIEQLESLGQLYVQRLPKSQVITIPSFAAEPVLSPFDAALSDFRHTLTEALTTWRNGKMSTTECAVMCEQLYDEAISGYATSSTLRVIGTDNGNLPQTKREIERAFCMVAVNCICEATIRKAIGENESENTENLVDFFENNLGSDWESFIEATKVLADLTIEGRSAALNGESDAVKAQFRSLGKPFLSVLTATPAFSHKIIANE